jgi:hypothetical protein
MSSVANHGTLSKASWIQPKRSLCILSRLIKLWHETGADYCFAVWTLLGIVEGSRDMGQDWIFLRVASVRCRVTSTLNIWFKNKLVRMKYRYISTVSSLGDLHTCLLGPPWDAICLLTTRTPFYRIILKTTTNFVTKIATNVLPTPSVDHQSLVLETFSHIFPVS